MKAFKAPVLGQMVSNRFFKKYWHILGDDIGGLVSNAFDCLR